MSSKVDCPYSSQGSHSHFPVEDVLTDITKYITCLKTALEKQNILLEEKQKRIVELQNRNNHLNKAVNTLKGQCSQALEESQQNEKCSCKRRRTESTNSQFDHEITILDYENDLNVSGSVMDTALNASALNTSSFLNLPLNTEVITATEKQGGKNQQNVRQRLLQKFNEQGARAKAYLLGDNGNNENKKPLQPKLPYTETASTSKRTSSIANRSTVDWLTKDEGNSTFKTSQIESEKPSDKGLKQSYLIRHGSQHTATLGLSKSSQKKKNCSQKNEDDEEENVFEFSATETFLLDTDSAPDLTNSFEAEKDIFSQANEDHTNSDPSVIYIPNPTLKPILVDDTRIEPLDVIKFERDEEDNDSLADFEMPNEAESIKPSPKIVLKARTTVKEEKDEATCSFVKPIDINIKQETLTTAIKREPINPIFQYTESSEEMEDDFETQQVDIDLKKVECEDCIKFLNTDGLKMTLEKKKKYLSKCKEQHPLIPDTPDGFWNPHLQSFSKDDPRNEIIIDKRRQQQKQ